VQPTDGDHAQHSPSRRADIIGTETIVADRTCRSDFTATAFGNVCGRLVAPAGGVTLRAARWAGFRIA